MAWLSILESSESSSILINHLHHKSCNSYFMRDEHTGENVLLKLQRQQTKNHHPNFKDLSLANPEVRKQKGETLANLWMKRISKKLFDDTDGLARSIFR